jgi:hypothetical protein
MTCRASKGVECLAGMILAVGALAACGNSTPVASVPAPSIDSDHAGPIQPTSAPSVPSGGWIKEVSAEGYRTAGKTWPLTVDSGGLSCSLSGSEHLIFKPVNPDNTTWSDRPYAVNGTARDLIKYQSGNGARVLDIKYLWADNPKTSGLKIDMTDFINDGLSICPPS